MSSNVADLKLPILYSFRRCPYAIRARLALIAARMNVQVREVNLSNKPAELLNASPKGTVPVLILANDTVIDESMDIISWAHSQFKSDTSWYWQADDPLLEMNDGDFKFYLDRYKYFEKFEGKSQAEYRTLCFPFLMQLESRLKDSKFLINDTHPSFIDLAILPFVRQFSKVDESWFEHSQFSNVNRWLSDWLQSDLFIAAMKTFDVWEADQLPVYLF